MTTNFMIQQNLSISNLQVSKIFVRDRESLRQRKGDIIGTKDIAPTFFSNFPKSLYLGKQNAKVAELLKIAQCYGISLNIFHFFTFKKKNFED